MYLCVHGEKILLRIYHIIRAFMHRHVLLMYYVVHCAKELSAYLPRYPDFCAMQNQIPYHITNYITNLSQKYQIHFKK